MTSLVERRARGPSRKSLPGFLSCRKGEMGTPVGGMGSLAPWYGPESPYAQTYRVSSLAVSDVSAASVGRDTVRDELCALFATAVSTAYPVTAVWGVEPLVVVAPQKIADYQCNNAMPIFGRLKGDKTMPADQKPKSPGEVSQAIIDALPPNDLIDSTEVTGPGFINIRLRDSMLTPRVEELLRHAQAVGGDPKRAAACWAPSLPGGHRKVVVDFSSPNIAKEMHVGHLRSTIIGDTLCRIFEYCGADVSRINHVGDWGTQFGMLIAHLEDLEAAGNDTEAGVSDLMAFYREAKARFDEDADFKARAQQRVVSLQGGDAGCLARWRRICDVSRQEFNKLYALLDIELEERGESFYNDLIPSTLAALDETGIMVDSNGAKCIFTSCEVTPLITRKSDGGFNYASTDLTALRHRLTSKAEGGEEATWLVYVTDVGQSLHFQMVFEAARMAGWMGEEAAQAAAAKAVKVAAAAKTKLDNAKKKAAKAPGDEGMAKSVADLQASAERYADVAVRATKSAEGAAGRLVGPIDGPAAPRLDHVSFGLVMGTDGKRFRTRSGDVVRLVDLLDEARDRTMAILESRGELSKEDMELGAEIIGYGAVKYADLKNNRETNYVFDFDRMLDLRGNTAIYMLYAYVRIRSIGRKALQSGVDVPRYLNDISGKVQVTHAREHSLVLHLVRFPETVQEALHELKPSKITDYLYELSDRYTQFYGDCKVIGSDEEHSRILLCEATSLVMAQAFSLLGMKTMERV